MKKKEKSSLANERIEVLQKQAAEIRQKLDGIRVDRSIKQVKNVREQKSLRNKRAVILTLIREKELSHE